MLNCLKELAILHCVNSGPAFSIVALLVALPSSTVHWWWQCWGWSGEWTFRLLLQPQHCQCYHHHWGVPTSNHVLWSAATPQNPRPPATLCKFMVGFLFHLEVFVSSANTFFFHIISVTFFFFLYNWRCSLEMEIRLLLMTWNLYPEGNVRSPQSASSSLSGPLLNLLSDAWMNLMYLWYGWLNFFTVNCEIMDGLIWWAVGFFSWFICGVFLCLLL